MKFKEKGIGILVLLVLFMLLIGSGTLYASGQGEAESTKEMLKIGFSFPTLQEERWSIEKDLSIEYCEDIGVKLLFQDAGTDAALQNQQIDNLITQGVDVLIVGAANIDATASAVKAAKDEGIPVISYLRMINSDELDAFVGYDFQKIGESKAQAALAAVPEGNYVFLNGDEGDSVVHEMKRGYDAVLKESYASGKIVKVFEQYTENWEPANALANMENCLTQFNNDVQVVIGNNDNVSGAAIQALEGQGILDSVYVNGMDGDLAACQRIVDGKQDATIVFLHSKLVEAVIDTAVALAKGETPMTINGTANNALAEIDAVLLGADLVTAENMVEKIIKSGVHKLEDVYANVPQDQWPTDY